MNLHASIMQCRERPVEVETSIGTFACADAKQVCNNARHADGISKMKTWVDASHAAHKDMKSHTGGAMSFGRRAAMSKSSKQKLRGKTLTKAEFGSASDYLPHPAWAAVKFLKARGHPLKENVFHHDN